MFDLLRKYIAMVWKSWGRKISGPVLAIFGLILLGFQLGIHDDNLARLLLKIGSRSTLGIAGMMILVAQYEVWKKEHEARNKAEADLNAEADMRGTIWATILQYNPLEDQNKDGSGLRFKCRCTNYGQEPCEISRACLVLSGRDFKDDLRLIRPLPLASVRTVGHGEQFTCDAGTFKIHGVKLSQLSRSQITIRLMNSLGTEYPNTVTKIVWGAEFDRL